MPRTARKKSETGIYHVMLRGADRRIIFSDEEDCERFLQTLRLVKRESAFKLYAYCLMGNHVHLLIEEGRESLETVFRRIGASYVYYYNWKYELHGHLFQDRYRSEAVETDAYFLDVLRYICQNPVKAGLSRKPFEYKWLGCGGVTKKDALTDSIEQWTEMDATEIVGFVEGECEQEHLEENGYKRMTDAEARERLCKVCGCRNVQEIGGWEKEQLEGAVLKTNEAGISIRQLSRLTGISKAVIERIIRSN